MRARGGADKHSEPLALKDSWPNSALRLAAPRRSSGCSIHSMACCSRSLLEAYLRDMADTDRSLGRQLSELLELIRQYGPQDVAVAIEKAAAARAFGAGYVTNILRQQRSPRRPQPPLRLRDPILNELATDPISLLEYDAYILESGKESDDPSRTETTATESKSDEPPDRDDDR